MFVERIEAAVGYVGWLRCERKRLVHKYGASYIQDDDFDMEIMFSNAEIRDAVSTNADVSHYEYCVDLAAVNAPELAHRWVEVPEFGLPNAMPPRADIAAAGPGDALRNAAAQAEGEPRRGVKRPHA